MRKPRGGKDDNSQSIVQPRLDRQRSLDELLRRLDVPKPLRERVLSRLQQWSDQATLLLTRQDLALRIRQTGTTGTPPLSQLTGPLLSVAKSKLGADFAGRLEKKLDQALLHEATERPEPRYGHVIWRSRYGARKHQLIFPERDPSRCSWEAAKIFAWFDLRPEKVRTLTIGRPGLVEPLSDYLDIVETKLENLPSFLQEREVALIVADAQGLSPRSLSELEHVISRYPDAPPVVLWVTEEAQLGGTLPHTFYTASEERLSSLNDRARNLVMGPLVPKGGWTFELPNEALPNDFPGDPASHSFLLPLPSGGEGTQLDLRGVEALGYLLLQESMLSTALAKGSPLLESEPHVAQGVRVLLSCSAPPRATLALAMAAGFSIVRHQADHAGDVGSSDGGGSDRDKMGQAAATAMLDSNDRSLETLLRDREHLRRQGQLSRRFAREAWGPRVVANRLLSALGLPATLTRAPLVSVICVSNRPQLFDACLETYARQSYSRKELILVANVDQLDPARVDQLTMGRSDVTVLRTDAALSLGESLNRARAVASGEIWTKLDDDDYYGTHYLRDMVFALESSGAEVCGKGTFYSYLEATDELFLTPEARENAFSPRYVHGGTIFAWRKATVGIDFPPVKRGTDTLFLQQCVLQHKRIYSADRYNFAYVRYQRPGHHTFDVSSRRYLKNSLHLGSGFRRDLIEL